MLKLLERYIIELKEKNRLEQEKLNIQKTQANLQISYSNMAWVIVEILFSLGIPKMLDEIADQQLFQWSTNSTLYFNFNVGISNPYTFKKQFANSLVNMGYNPNNFKVKVLGNMLKVELV